MVFGQSCRPFAKLAQAFASVCWSVYLWDRWPCVIISKARNSEADLSSTVSIAIQQFVDDKRDVVSGQVEQIDEVVFQNGGERVRRQNLECSIVFIKRAIQV